MHKKHASRLSVRCAVRGAAAAVLSFTAGVALSGCTTVTINDVQYDYGKVVDFRAPAMACMQAAASGRLRDDSVIPESISVVADSAATDSSGGTGRIAVTGRTKVFTDVSTTYTWTCHAYLDGGDYVAYVGAFDVQP